MPAGSGADGGSVREHNKEYLLYTSTPISIPSRHSATFAVSISVSLASRHGVAVLVDRLPNRVGLDEPPMLETRLETPTETKQVYVTV